MGLKRQDNGLLVLVCEPGVGSFNPPVYEMNHMVDVIRYGTTVLANRLKTADLRQANAWLYWPSCRVGGSPNPFNSKRIERIVRLKQEREPVSLGEHNG